MEKNEKFITRIKSDTDSELMELHNLFKTEFNEIKEKISLIKEEFAERMHKKKVNELKISVYGIEFISKYQSKTTRSIDSYSALLEIVGDEQYSELVNEKLSTFIVIRKAPKKKKSKKSIIKPVNDEISLPVGKLT